LDKHLKLLSNWSYVLLAFGLEPMHHPQPIEENPWQLLQLDRPPRHAFRYVPRPQLVESLDRLLDLR
jgi:hypothetical protein